MQQLHGLNFEVDGSTIDGDDPESSSTGSESIALYLQVLNDSFRSRVVLNYLMVITLADEASKCESAM